MENAVRTGMLGGSEGRNECKSRRKGGNKNRTIYVGHLSSVLSVIQSIRSGYKVQEHKLRLLEGRITSPNYSQALCP